jgi:hypothetical protein
MARPLTETVSSFVKVAVESTLSIAKNAPRHAKGVARLYNSLARLAPFPLPRIPDGSKYVHPSEAYTPPPPPPRPDAPVKVAPVAPPPLTEVPGATPPKPTGGLVVEVAGPTLDEWRQRNARPASSEPETAPAPSASALSESEAATSEESTPALESLTKADLEARLRDAGVPFKARATKAELLALLKAHP